MCQVLPAYHSITGCNTSSFAFGIGKVKPFKKMEKLGKCYLLHIWAHHLLHEESVTTRIRMYNKQKVKSSSSILPDESSTNVHLKRSDLQAFVWHQCLKPNIAYPSIKYRGLEKMEDVIQPIWFICHQFPPSLSLMSSKTR